MSVTLFKNIVSKGFEVTLTSSCLLFTSLVNGSQLLLPKFSAADFDRPKDYKNSNNTFPMKSFSVDAMKKKSSKNISLVSRSSSFYAIKKAGIENVSYKNAPTKIKVSLRKNFHELF